MKISVIIPAYNAIKTIDATLASLDQQEVRDFEVILVDDGSTDGTFEHVSQNYPKVRAFRQPNQGPAAARNRAALEAKGVWLAFLDADDAWLPWRLKSQLALVALHPDYALICGKTVGLEDEIKSPDWGEVPTGSQLQELRVEDFLLANPVATTTVLLKKEAFDQVSGFDESLRGPEDYDLWMRVATRYKCARILYPLSRYRDEIGSLSRDHERFLPQVLKLLDKAFAPGGAFAGMKGKGRAVAFQQVGAAWMALQANFPKDALCLLLASYRSYPWRLKVPGKSPNLRAAMIFRSLKGFLRCR